MLKNAKISRSISIVLSSFTYIMFVAFMILQITNNMENTSRTDSEALLHPSIFPYDAEKSPNLQVTWMGQFIGIASMTLCYSSFDTFLAVLVLHLCGQLSILRNALEDLANRNHQTKFRERLVYIVHRHNELSRFAVTVEECFNLMLLVQTVMITLMFCMTGYRLINSVDHEEEKVPIYEMIFCFMHVTNSMLHFFIYCYAGEMLVQESTGIAQSAYDCIWYDLPPKQATLMIMIIHRAGVSLKITAGKFSPFSFELFNAVPSYYIQPAILLSQQLQDLQDYNICFQLFTMYNCKKREYMIAVPRTYIHQLSTQGGYTFGDFWETSGASSIIDEVKRTVGANGFRTRYSASSSNLNSISLDTKQQFHLNEILHLEKLFQGRKVNNFFSGCFVFHSSRGSKVQEISWVKEFSHPFKKLCSLITDVIDLRDAIGWNRLNLRIVGIWPEPVMLHERLANFRACVSAVWIMIFVNIWQSVDLFMVGNDMSKITSILSLANIPGYNSVFKLVFVWYYRKDLQPVIQSFYDDWYAPKTEEERRTMVDSARICKQLAIWCTVLTQCMLCAYIGTRSYAIATCDINTEPSDHLTIYPAYYPLDLRRTTLRVVVNVGQVFAAYCSVIPYTSVDIFIATLVLHTCGQFTNLRRKLENLMDGSNGKNVRDSDDIQKELAAIVKRHEHLIWAAARIDECFSILLFLQMLLSTVEICFQGYLFFNVILKNEEGILNFQFLFLVLFISFVIVHMFVYCYVGEMLRVQSTDMAVSAYEARWYNVAPPEAKCLQFVMLRSTRPLCLTAGKFGTFSMEMFSRNNAQSASEVDLGGLLHPATFPYDTKKSPNFEITWVAQLIGSALTAISFSCFDTFLAVLVLHLCGQLSVLRAAIEHITETSSPGVEFNERLGYIVCRHNQLSRFAVIVEDCFNRTLLVQILICTAMLCLTGYRLLTVRSRQITLIIVSPKNICCTIFL
ncbi:uncharacterized protein LOC143212564 [Lasioglossum baleicum]|uniref:uncharacterized protein LOC143212564 n=1 Tax=Lasioglossum baleicum TaxID=434251 RepID=UPI003FCE0A3A